MPAPAPPPDWIGVLTVLGLGAYGALEKLRSEDEEPDEWTVDGSEAAYARGEISLEEHEERVAAAEAGTPEYRRALERVDGVGPELSGRIRREFPTREQLREADPGELEAVHGVGPSTAEELRRRL